MSITHLTTNLLSYRGHPLVYTKIEPAVLTVELTLEDWNGLHLVRKLGRGFEITNTDFKELEIGTRFNIPYSNQVLGYAASCGYLVDRLALELIVGRLKLLEDCASM